MEYAFRHANERAKNASFHESESLLLVCYRFGDIQLWDYNQLILLHTFHNAHDKMTRCVDFYPNIKRNENISEYKYWFVSCGDDKLIKIWDYKSYNFVKQYKFHSDYVRNVQFYPHSSFPWLLSCSDDQSIVITNYERDFKVHEITAHYHYIWWAKFDDRYDNIIMSAGLEGSIKIHDISVLMKLQSKNGDCCEAFSSKSTTIATVYICVYVYKHGISY